MVRLAVRVPLADGVNFTLIEQLAPPARLEPQVLVCEKSPLFAPVIAMLEIFSCVLPTLRKVTVLAALVVPTVRLAKVSVVGDKETAVPIPLRLTD